MAIKEKIKAMLMENIVITESSSEAKELGTKSGFGKLQKSQVRLSIVEALYLVEKEKLEVSTARKIYDFNSLLQKARRLDKNVFLRYAVFKDLREKGYLVKTALKFGAEYRVYDKGIKVGQDHSKWVVYPVHENDMNNWHDFSAKNRVAHSTKKRLMIGIVDDEGDVTYYEVKWIRP